VVARKKADVLGIAIPTKVSIGNTPDAVM